MNGTTPLSQSIANGKMSRFWQRLGSVLEDAGVSYAERLERRLTRLEQDVAALQHEASAVIDVARGEHQ